MDLRNVSRGPLSEVPEAPPADAPARPRSLFQSQARSGGPALARDLALGLLLCLVILGLILFASGDSGADRGFIYVDF